MTRRPSSSAGETEHAYRHLALRLLRALSLVESPARGGRSSVGRASDCGSEGRGFESRRSPSYIPHR